MRSSTYFQEMRKEMQAIDWGKYTPARKVDLIQEVYQPENSSAHQLAERLFQKYGFQVSRNAIIGLYGRRPDLKQNFPLTGTRHNHGEAATSAQGEHALRLAQQRSADRARAAEERQRKANARKLAASTTVTPEVEQSRSARRAEIDKFFDENSYAIPFSQLSDTACRWPHGDSNFVFCGRDDIAKGRSYCLFHAKLAYSPGN